jgi:large repetitive protein
MQLTTIILEASSNAIGIGGISVISATCNISPCPALNWLSSDPTLADLEPNPATVSCFVTGKSNGTVNITASADGITSNTITITVTGPSLQSIKISPKIVSISIGKTLLFNATCKDQYNYSMTCPTLTWNSDNPSVGTIDQNGSLTGLSKGTTSITASAAGITSDNALVTVSPENFGEIIIFGGLIIGFAYMILKHKTEMETLKL